MQSGFIPSLVAAKAFAATKALEFAIDQGIRQVILEADALCIINVVKDDDPCLSTFGNRIEEARNFFMAFQLCHVKHVQCITNNTAYTLAKHILSINDVYVWIEDYPDIIKDIIVTDCTNIFS